MFGVLRVKLLGFLVCCLLLIACGGGTDATSDESGNGSENDNSPNNDAPLLPSTLLDYESISLPTHYTTNAFSGQARFQRAASQLDNTPVNNPITNAGATLGRVLFYDRKLSANGTIACASCHDASHGFSDPNVFSFGFDGGTTRRHSMGLVNARFYASGKFFWDERADTLEDQVLMPFQDQVEMGLSLQELENIVAAQSYYPALFTDAFGDSTVSSDRIALALAQFVRSMVSTTAPYDIARAGVNTPEEDFPGFTAQQNLGKRLFYLPVQLTNGQSASCASCHISEAFVGVDQPGPGGSSSATVNGLDAVSDDDQGVFESTGNTADLGKFKVPSLRNIAIRPPYMHDGRLETLADVIDHYSGGIQNHPNLRPTFRGENEAAQFIFTPEEKAALIAFLETLSDTTMLNDEKFSDPFSTQ